MKTQFCKNSVKVIYTILGMVILLNAAQSASFNSGKTKKKSSTKSTSLTFHLHNKSNYLFSSNGFIYKGSLHAFYNQNNKIDIQLKSLYFLKGNNLYVQPIKNKIIISKFKTPQKLLY